jgi:hypothetical protein
MFRKSGVFQLRKWCGRWDLHYPTTEYLSKLLKTRTGTKAKRAKNAISWHVYGTLIHGVIQLGGWTVFRSGVKRRGSAQPLR